MKTFLQSAIDCFKSEGFRACDPEITPNNYKICEEFYNFKGNEQFCNDKNNERSVYFLLFIAAERGEL